MSVIPINLPVEDRRNATIRINPKLKSALQIQAFKEQRSLSDLIQDAALLYLKSVEEKDVCIAAN